MLILKLGTPEARALIKPLSFALMLQHLSSFYR